MKKRIFLASILSAFMLFNTSCKKDEENNSDATITTTVPAELPATESKATVSKTASSLKTDLSAMSENASMDALESFVGTMSSDESSSNTARQAKKNIKDYIDIVENTLSNSVNASNARLTEEEFDLETSKGIYEWNATKDNFDKTSEASNLVIKFPSTEEGTTNDATFIVNSYKEDANENPTDVDMVLTLDSKTIFSIDFSATFDGEDPTSINGSIKMPPFSYTVDAKQTSNSVSLSTSINSDNLSIPIASASFNGTFADSELEEPTKISGHTSLYELTLKADVDIKAIDDAMEQSDDMDVETVNKHSNVYFEKTSTNQKIGDVVAQKVEGEEDPDFVVKYTDGSTEDLEVVFDDTIDEIDTFLNEFDLY